MFYNEELNSTFLHIPKCGGAYVRDKLKKCYGFNDLCRDIHVNHYDFVEDEYHYAQDKDKYCHSIRTKGKYRFFITHQDINIDKIKKSFKFTFVRNPYEKILSAYKYMIRCTHNNIIKKTQTHNTLENIEYLKDFNTFLKNYKNVINISYSHAFITQYDQMCDFSGNINFNYIGKTETLDDDLINVLFLLGVKNQEHLKDNCENVNASKYDKPIYEYYNEESLKFVNEWFKIDFETFDYKILETFQEFKQYFITKTNQQKQLLDIDFNYKEIPLEIHPRISIESKQGLIPKRIMQTFLTNVVDIQIYNNIMKFLDKNKEYSYYFVTDKIGRELIEKHFSKKTLYAFDKLHIGAAKADFIRYIYLYLYGGIYLDIDADIRTNLNEFIKIDDEYIFILSPREKITVNQWFIAIMPLHPIMKKIIEEMENRILHDETNLLISTGPRLFTCVLYNYFNNKELYDISKLNNENIALINEIINKSKKGRILYEETYTRFISFHFPGYYTNMLYTNTNHYADSMCETNIILKKKILSKNNHLYFILQMISKFLFKNLILYNKTHELLVNLLEENNSENKLKIILEKKKHNNNYKIVNDLITNGVGILYNNNLTTNECIICKALFMNNASYNSHIKYCK
jgi:mannosyltransferase OCH1-like enzyme